MYWHSIEKFVSESLLIPDTVGIENEDFFGFHVSKDHIRIEHVDSPELFAGYNIGINLLEILNINSDSFDSSE